MCSNGITLKIWYYSSWTFFYRFQKTALSSLPWTIQENATKSGMLLPPTPVHHHCFVFVSSNNTKRSAAKLCTFIVISKSMPKQIVTTRYFACVEWHREMRKISGLAVLRNILVFHCKTVSKFSVKSVKQNNGSKRYWGGSNLCTPANWECHRRFNLSDYLSANPLGIHSMHDGHEKWSGNVEE